MRKDFLLFGSPNRAPIILALNIKKRNPQQTFPRSNNIYSYKKPATNSNNFCIRFHDLNGWDAIQPIVTFVFVDIKSFIPLGRSLLQVA